MRDAVEKASQLAMKMAEWYSICEREASKYFENVFYIRNNRNTKYSCKSISNTSTSTSGKSI